MTTAKEIVTVYKNPDKDPVAFGSMLLAAQKQHGWTQQELARQCGGITPGTVHHYTSLLSLPPHLQRAVSQKKLRFKAARALADLPVDPSPHARPFMDGVLSTVYVEPYIKLVKQYPDIEPEKAVDMLRHPENYEKARYKFDVEAAVPEAPEPEQYVTPAHIRQGAINFRALLKLCNWDLTVDSMYACRQLEQLRTDIDRLLSAQKVAL